jgi:AhpD family alkylhydroperoxidase
LLDRILYYKVAPGQIRYLKSIDYGAASGLAGAVMEQMETDFLVGPPLTVHMPHPELMAGLWSLCRECLAAGRIPRTSGDVIAGTVSRLNTCPYCFSIHTSMLYSFGAPELAGAVLTNGKIADEQTNALAQWAAATLTPGAGILKTPPFTAEQAPQVIGTAICFHYLNRIVNVFLEPMPGSTVSWLKGPMSRMNGRIMRQRLSNQTLEPGRFLSSDPAIELPAEFRWAAGDANIAGAVRRFVAAAEAAGHESVNPSVQSCVLDRIGAWNGEAPGLGRGWLEEAVSPLSESLRPSARLALLTALASYQVDDEIVASFRAIQPGDRDLINTAAWASYSAILRIGAWLPEPRP